MYMKNNKVISKTEVTTTIRVTKETKELIKSFGNIGDNYNDGIQNLHKELQKQIEINKQIRRKNKK